MSFCYVKDCIVNLVPKIQIRTNKLLYCIVLYCIVLYCIVLYFPPKDFPLTDLWESTYTCSTSHIRAR